MVIAADLSSDDEDMAHQSGAAPVLQEALGVTPTGTCVRHPNCPVLSLAHNKVMSCRVCFSEEKSVGIRQRKSFAAVVQQLQQQSEGGRGDKDDDDDDDEPRRRVKRAHSASMQALILQQPQTMESIMKRLGQVQNWMLRQKEKEVMSLQLHIQRLEQRLHDTEVQNQEQKQTIWALRRTIQQDLKIIKTMAVQHERELENSSKCGGPNNALDRSSAHRSMSSGTGDGGSVSGMELRSPKFVLSDSGSVSSADNTPSTSPMKTLPPLAAESPASGRTNNSGSGSQHSRIQASLEKYKRAQASSSTPRQRTSSSDSHGDQPVSYVNKDNVFVENQRSSYWNDEEVDRMSSNPAKIFASFRGGLLDIPKSPPRARHDSRRKVQLNADDLAQLKMPRMRGIGRSLSHASTASAISDDGSSAPSFLGLPPMDGGGGGVGGAPTTLLSLPMPVSIGETSPEVIYEEPKSAADASPDATGGGTSNESSNNKAASSMPEPPVLHSPSAQNAKLPTRSSPSHESTSSKDKNDTSTTTTTASAAGSTTVETGKVKKNNNAEATDNKTVLSATYSVTSLFTKQLSAKTFASGYDQHSVATSSTFAAEEEGDQADDSVIATTAAREQSSAAQEQQSPASEEADKSKGDGGSGGGGGGESSKKKGGGNDKASKEGTVFNVTGAQCQDKYGDTGMYVGTILVTQGMPHGEGTMNYDSGRVYSGSWVVGQWHGKGKLLNPNGDTYEGQFIFDARHGKGLYKWDNGDVYTGDFSQDKRNGHGKFCFHNGNVYEGEFRDGMFEGFGRYDFEGGSYEGEWVQGRYHGEGTLTYASGGKYTGEFRDSLAHGFGLEILPDGRKRRGMWEAGQPTQNFAKPW